MTRGMFVTALGRLAGIDQADYKTGKFTDVKADAYYAPYVNELGGGKRYCKRHYRHHLFPGHQYHAGTDGGHYGKLREKAGL